MINLFGPLNAERKKRKLNRLHTNLIREAVLDIVRNESDEVFLDSSANTIDNDNTVIHEDYLTSIESKVDALFENQNFENFDENKLEELAINLSGSIGDAPNVSSNTN
jgi:hypothetical protein